MSQVKCFNFDLLKGVVGSGKLSYRRLKSENKPDVGDYVFGRIESFVDEDYPIDDRLKMSYDKRCELIDLIIKAASDTGIFYDPEFIEKRLFPDVSLAESTEQDESNIPINIGSIFRMPKSYVSDDQKMYGSQMYPRMMMQSAFKRLSTRAFFIRNGRAVNPNNVSMNILLEKLNLVSDILDNLPDKKIQYVDNGKRVTVPMMKKQVQNMMDIISETGKENRGLTYLDKIDKLSQLPSIRMDIIESMFTRNSILSVADDVLNKWANGTESEKAKLRSYNNIFILRNFDALLKKNFNNLVDIKGEGSNGDVSFVDYKIKLDSNNINKSWQNQSDDVSSYKESGNVFRAILETMPFYKYKSESVTENTIEQNKFNNAIGFLKNIPYTSSANLEVYMLDEFGKMQLAGKIGDMISDINNDPSKNMKRVFDALFTGTDVNGTKFIKSLMDRFFIKKDYQRNAVIDMLYSINQSFYGDKKGLNIYKTMSQNKYNPDIPDYYSFMTQYMIGSYRMNFVYFKRNPKVDDYEVRGYVMNNRSLRLTEDRVNSRIYNASKGIVNEFISISRNKTTSDMMGKFGEKENQQSSVRYELIEPANSAESLRSRVIFNAIPMNGKLYNISYDTTNANVMASDNTSAFTIVERLSNGKTSNPVSIKEIVSEAIKNGNMDNLSTDLDDILSIAYSIPINSDESLRRVLYDDNGKFNESTISTLLKGAFSIIGTSEVNNSYISKLDNAEAINNALVNKKIFPLQKEGRSSVMKLFNRPGINNISSNIGNAMDIIFGAVAYTDNVLGRDTISSPDGTQISATQMNRLVSSFDSQSKRIKDAAKDGNPSPAKFLMINSTAGEFFDNLVYNGVIDESDTEILNGINRDEPLFKGSYTTRIANINNQTKKRANFNIQESLISDYVVNFLNNVYGKPSDDVDAIYNGDDIIFNTQINADKGQITYGAINGNLIRNIAAMSEQKRMNVMKAAFGNMYNQIYSVIKNTYSRIDESIANIAKPESKAIYDRHLSIEESIMMDKFLSVYPQYSDAPIFNELVNSNFARFNELADAAGVNAYELAMLLSKVHNALNPNDRIDFIDQTHFLKKKIRDGRTHIQFNRLLASKIMRFSPESVSNFNLATFTDNPRFFNNWEQFYNAKNNELFFSMIDNGINLSINNSSGRDNGFAGLKVLKEANPEWFTGDKMILGKIIPSEVRELELVNREISKLSATINEREAIMWSTENDPAASSIIGDEINLLKSQLESLKSRRIPLENAVKTRKQINVTSEDDIRAFLEKAMSDAHIGGMSAVDNALSSSLRLNEELAKMNYAIETNPDLVKFNWIDYFIGQSYEISSVGDNFNHPVKASVNNDMELDAFSTYAQIKRNVSQTTTIRPFVVDHLNTIPKVINVAPIEDISNSVSSFSGMFKNISPHDGISFLSPTTAHLFNNGLMNSRVGIDMKTFFHDYNIPTSTGVIIKTSSDTLTNQTIKQGKNMKRMAYKMMGAVWMDVNNNPINGDIFSDYAFRLFDNAGNRQNLFSYISNKYHPMVELSRGNVYEITNIYRVEDSADGTPMYEREMKLVDKNGDYDESEQPVIDRVPIQSNYDLWEALGAENSKMKSPDTGKIVDSENSILALVDIMNNNGITYNNEAVYVSDTANIKSQADIYQFMKFGNADVVASHGAMKQGYTNVNRYQDFYFNKKGLLNTMKFDLTHSGVVLDPTHKADNSMISELTQVINALSSRGFTKGKSSQIYDALASITISSMMDIVNKTGGTIEHPNYNDLAANLIVMSMVESNAFSDKAREDCADLMDIVKNGGTITYSDIRKRIDIGSNSFILSAIPVIASYINTMSIVKKNAGTNALMKASSGIVQMFGNRLYGDIGVNDIERLDYLNGLESSQIPFENPSRVDMGHIYKIQMTADEFNNVYDNSNYEKIKGNIFHDGTYAYFNLKDILVYNTFRDMHAISSNKEIREAFVRNAIGDEEADITVDNVGYIALGRELAPINYHFSVNGSAINMYDLVASKLIFRARNGENVDADINNILMTNYRFEEPLSNSMSTFDKAMVLYQKELNNISDAYNGKGGWVTMVDADGNITRADIEGDVSIKYYEAVAPNINQTKLGIGDDVNIQDINKGYFAKKLVTNFGLKVDPEHYTYSLLKQSGKHIYIYDTSNDISKPFSPDGSMTKVNIRTEFDKNGHLYRLDNKGNQMYEISPNDTIYRKKNGAEIIVTDRPSIPIGSFGFYGIKISPNVYKNANVDTIPQNRAYVDNIISTIFKSASAIFNESGDVIEGSESALYWTKEQEDGTDYLTEKLEIAFNDYESIRDGKEIDSNSSYLQEQYARAIADGRIEDFRNGTVFQRSVYRDATALYNSFKESLNSIVARTPSQTMQSFMPMTIVAFDKSGNNSAYVSDMQVWLQGSDFDGDKTNFQEYALNNRGLFIGWSNLFKLDNLRESLRIPFPTSVQITDMVRIKDDIQGEYDALFNHLFKFNEKTKLYERVSEDIPSLVRFLEIVNEDSSAYNKGVLRLPTKVKATQLESVKKLIDGHNMYMVDMDNTKMNGTKNFITYKSLSITEDPANLYESQSSVDDMDDISKLGEDDKKSAERLKISSGNVILKYDAMVNNIVGKNVISVVASGMKTFFNIANYFNTMTDGERNRILLGKNGDGIKILGKTYNFVANWNPTEGVRQKLREITGDDSASTAELITNIKKLLDGAQSEKNAGLILSALLSEATDNAKNLNLAKINADESMAPLYIYGITIGMDIKDLGSIMMSETARLYAKMRNGNIFYGESGPTSIQKFRADYIDTKNSYGEVNDLGLSNLPELASNILKSSPVFKRMLDNSFISERAAIGYEPTSNNYYALEDVRKYAFSQISMSSSTQKEKERAISDMNNYIDKVKRVLYVRRAVHGDKVNVGNESYKIIDALEELEKGRNEMLLASRIVGLNKGVKTTRDKQLSFINSMRSIFNGDTNKDGRTAADNFLKRYSDNPYSDTAGFDMIRFMNNPDYGAEAIDIYEKYFKHTINILDLTYSLPLIRSYMDVSNISNGITTGISVKNKVVDWLSERAMQDLGRLNQMERMSVIRNTGMYVNSSLFNRFLGSSNGNVFHIPADSEYYNDDITLVPISRPTPEKLGTRRGNANYLKWMNETVIPNMKNGIYDETGNTQRKIVNNKFINNLGMVSIDKTLSGIPLDVYSPTVDKRSNNEYDVMMVAVLSNSAKKLDSAIYVDSNGMRHNVSDLLYIYNQLSFNGVNTTYSMDEFLSTESSVRKAYSDFETNVLTEDNATQLVPYDYMNMNSPGILQYLAPQGNTNSSNSRILRGYNHIETKVQFYRNIDKNNNKNHPGDFNEDSYNETLMDMIDNQQTNGFEDEFGYLYDNYSGYNDSRYSIIDTAKKEYDNYVFAGGSSIDIIKSAMNYNRVTANERLDGKSFNLINESSHIGDTRFSSFNSIMNAIRAKNANGIDLNTIRDMISTVANSTTGVVKMGMENGKEYFLMDSKNSMISLLSKQDEDLFYINRNGMVNYIAPEIYNSLGFGGFVGSNNFDAVKSTIDEIENNKMCSL